MDGTKRKEENEGSCFGGCEERRGLLLRQSVPNVNRSCAFFSQTKRKIEQSARCIGESARSVHAWRARTRSDLAVAAWDFRRSGMCATQSVARTVHGIVHSTVQVVRRQGWARFFKQVEDFTLSCPNINRGMQTAPLLSTGHALPVQIRTVPVFLPDTCCVSSVSDRDTKPRNLPRTRAPSP